MNKIDKAFEKYIDKTIIIVSLSEDDGYIENKELFEGKEMIYNGLFFKFKNKEDFEVVYKIYGKDNFYYFNKINLKVKLKRK